MSNNDGLAPAQYLLRYHIGDNSYLRNQDNYPPHNLMQSPDGQIILSLAVAGFSRSEISVQAHENILTVSGSKETDESFSYDSGWVVHHKGIADRMFKKHFKINDQIEIESAELADGILKINLRKNEPEKSKPIKIEIK